MRRALLLSLFSLQFLTGCNLGSTGSSGDGRRSPTLAGPAETTYCSTPISYSGGTTVTGTAQYIRRRITEGGATAGLGSADPNHATRPADVRPIRGAEVRVTNTAGTVVQCAQTDSNGAFSILLPAGSAIYTVSINSRSAQFNGGATYLNASVLNRPEANVPYTLSTTVNPGTTTSMPVMTADAYSSGAILGAPFNILDMLYESTLYLQTQTGSCSATFPGCRNVTTSSAIPKVVAYWEKGFNPNDYFGSSSGLSFYLPGYSRLFILGGVDGDVDSSDTDHFDNSVIIHEYGHFLEDVISASDSPGGSHNGNKVIDPRLAWSEGWGNFFQAAVNGAAKYYDTKGNIDGDPDLIFAVNLETALSGFDVPSYQGEGNFREFSVTRMLWDAIDNTPTESASTDNISGKFAEIWAAFTKTAQGFNSTNYAFRNIGLLHYSQQALGASDWSQIRTINLHDGDTSHYANYVSAAGSCASLTNGLFSINPSAGTSTPTLFQQHRFFHIKLAAGAHTITVRYQTVSGPIEADLDLALYSEEHALSSTTGLIGRAEASPDDNMATPSTESISANFLAGNYLLDVTAFTGVDHSVNYKNAQTTEFSIKLDGGSDLCPASL